MATSSKSGAEKQPRWTATLKPDTVWAPLPYHLEPGAAAYTCVLPAACRPRPTARGLLPPAYCLSHAARRSPVCSSSASLFVRPPKSSSSSLSLSLRNAAIVSFSLLSPPSLCIAHQMARCARGVTGTASDAMRIVCVHVPCAVRFGACRGRTVRQRTCGGRSLRARAGCLVDGRQVPPRSTLAMVRLRACT